MSIESWTEAFLYKDKLALYLKFRFVAKNIDLEPKNLKSVARNIDLELENIESMPKNIDFMPENLESVSEITEFMPENTLTNRAKNNNL